MTSRFVQSVYSFALTALLFGISLSLEAATIEINPDVRHQTLEGFGAGFHWRGPNLMLMLSDERRNEIYDLVFRDLGASHLGVYLYSQFRPSSGSAYVWNDPLFVQQRQVIQAALARGVVTTVWVKAGSPPGWMKDNGTASLGGKLLPAMSGEYARYLAEYVRGMRDTYQISLQGVSPFNEPGIALPYESTETSPEEFKEFLKTLGDRFQADGLSSWILGPENISIFFGSAGALSGFYLQTVTADTAARSFLGRITVHQYADYVPTENWANLKTIASSHGKAVWMTEGSLIGSSTTVTHGIEDGLTMAWLMWRAITEGDVTAWHYFTYIWPYDEQNSFGLIEIMPDATVRVPKVYYCFKQWAKHIPPGAVRVSATSDDSNIQTAAFKTDRGIVVLGLNRTTADIQTMFRAPSVPTLVELVRTSASDDHQTQPAITAQNNAFTTTLPARSLSTFLIPGAPTIPAPPREFRLQ